MSKLFRARTKRLEDLPEHSRCCQAYIDATLASPEMIIDRACTAKEITLCNYCHAEHYGIGVLDTLDGLYVHLDELEIDEKPISEEVAL